MEKSDVCGEISRFFSLNLSVYLCVMNVYLIKHHSTRQKSEKYYFFGKCWNLSYSISQKMLEMKSPYLT